MRGSGLRKPKKRAAQDPADRVPAQAGGRLSSRQVGILVYGPTLLLLSSLFLIARALTAHQGLAVDFGLQLPGGDRVTVERATSRAVWYPSYWQILIPYLEGWDESRWGFPSQVPRLDVEWTGIFSVPRAGPFRFDAEAEGSWQVQIGSLAFGTDVAASQSGVLAQGDHPVTIRLKGNTDQTHIKLYQVLEDGRRVPARAGFFPAARDRLAHRRVVAMAISLTAAFVVISALVWQRLRKAVSPEEIQPHLRIAAVAVMLLLAFGLRLYDRSFVPWPTETSDEYYGAWAGWSLVHEGKATSWSWYSPYRNTRMTQWFGHDFRLVSPFFDQPPLAFTLTGLWGSVAYPFVSSPSGTGPFFDGPPLGVLRVLPIALSCVSMLLILHLGRRLFSWWAGVAAGLIYATTPMLVPLHRLLKEENLFTPLALGALALALAARSTPSRRLLVPLGALCGLVVGVKFTALFVPVMCAAILLTGPLPWRRSGVLHVASGTAAGAAAVLLFAGLQDWGLFWEVTGAAGSKPLGFLTAAKIIFDPRVVYDSFGPAWVWWMWLAAVPAMAARGRPLALALSLYLVVICASAAREPLYGWYGIPLYALLMPAAGAELVSARSRVPVRFLFWILYLACSADMLEQLGTIPSMGYRLRLFLLAALPILWLELTRSAAAARARAYLGWGLLIAACAINSFLALNLPFVYVK